MIFKTEAIHAERNLVYTRFTVLM